MEHGWALLLFGTVCLSSLLHVAGSATPVVVTLDKVIPVTTASCKFPFTYDGKSYVACTNANATNPASFWCSVDAVYSTGRWGFCPVTLNKPSLKTKLGTCNFPVDVNGPNGFKVRFFECSNAFEEAASGSAPAGKEMCKSTTNQIISCPTPATVAARVCIFTKLAGKKNSGATQQPGVNKRSDCESQCETLVTCVAYEWQNVKSECWIYTTFSSSFTDSATNDFYRKDCAATSFTSTTSTTSTTTATTTTTVSTSTSSPASPVAVVTGAAVAGGCIDTFVTASNTGLSGGIQAPSSANANTAADCTKYCLSKSFVDCAATDFDASNACYTFKSTQLSGTTRVAAGVTHAVRIQCDATTTTATPTPSVPTCIDTFNKSVNSNQLMGVLQVNVITQAACQADCLALQTCTGFDYTSDNKCWRHISKGTINANKVNVDHYERVACVDVTATTACTDSFTEQLGQQLFTGTAAPAYNNNPAGCQAWCLGQSTCTHYEIDANNACYWHAKPGATPVSNGNNNHKLFTRVPCLVATTVSGVCRDTFTANPNAFKYDGVPVAGNAVDACTSACLARTELCVAFDFDAATKKCFLHGVATQSAPLQAGNGVSHNVRNFECNATSTALACRDPFTKTENRNRAGGVRATGISTQTNCEKECLKTEKSDSNACYGYDFNTQNNECYVHMGSIPSTTGAFPNVNTYERQFLCGLATTVLATGPTGVTGVTGLPGTGSTAVTGLPGTGSAAGFACVDNFASSPNSNAYLGVLKAAATTEPACRALCVGTNEGDPKYCFGYDFDGTNSQCWFQERTADYQINVGSAPGVTHYKRTRVCPSTVVTGVGQCPAVYSVTERVHGLGGKGQDGVYGLKECRARCSAMLPTQCSAFDLDLKSGKCYLFAVKKYKLEPSKLVVHYRRTPCLQNIVADDCVEEFRRHGNVEVNYTNGDSEKLDECMERCSAHVNSVESEVCYGIEYNTTSMQCHLKTIPGNNENLTSSDVLHFTRVTNQCSKIPSTVEAANIACGSGFTVFTDTNGAAGVKQSFGTRSACEQNCIVDSECYAYDWDRNKGECWKFGEGYRRTVAGTVIGVDHYLRQQTGSACGSTGGGNNCQYTIKVNTNGQGGTIQNGVSTQTGCSARCNGAGLPSGTTCHGYDYTSNNQCYIFTSKNYIINPEGTSTNVNHYVKDPNCGSTSGTCTNEFTELANRNGAGGIRQSGLSTAQGCRVRCLSATCYAYDFDTIQKQCYTFPNINYQMLPQAANGVNHFKRTCNTGSTNCPYTLMENTNGQGGIVQTGVDSQITCEARCNGNGLQSGETCYGYDVNLVNKQCFIFTKSDYVTSPEGSALNINHYKKRPGCGGSGTCTNDFFEYSNRNGESGTQQNIGINSANQCKDTCIASSVTCYAYDFDTRASRCYLFLNSKYKMRTGTAVGVNHYKRTCTSTSTCQFTKFEHTNGAGGILQNSVVTQPACQSRCNGDGIATGTTCYAYDFDTLSSLCYIFTSSGYTRNILGGAQNVNHYVKGNCGASGTCTDTFSVSTNKNGAGGIQQSGNVNSADQCKATCIANGVTCYAYDFDKNQNLCYIFTDANYKMRTGSANGVDHYKRTCTGGCTDTFFEYTNKNGAGGIRQSNVNRADQCKATCIASGLTCYAYDFDNNQNQCYIFTDVEYKIRTGAANGVNHYKRTCPDSTDCSYTKFDNTNGAGGILQNNVATKPDCQSRCNGNGLASGTCYAYDFDTLSNLCYIFTSASYIRNDGNAQNVNHYVKDTNCGSGAKCQFTKYVNTNGAGGILQNKVVTQLDCQSRCNGNGLASGTACYAYDFDTLSNLCYIFTSSSYTRNSIGGAQNVNHYVKAANCGSGTTNCPYTMTANTNGQGGVVQNGVSSQLACEARCNGLGLQTGTTCYGYDINHSNNKCFIFLTRNYVTNSAGSALNVNHYKKQENCGSSGTCMNSFFEYAEKNGAGGLEQTSTVNTAEKCKTACINNAVICYGYDFNTLNNKCYLFQDANYQLRTGVATGINHYKRSCTGTPNCAFTEYSNTNGAGGLLQNKVVTQLDCQSRCNGNGLASGTTCYAYDFDTLSSLCYIFTSDGYTRNAVGGAPNVNHYVKATNCGGSGADCKFTEYSNTNGAGGLLQNKVVTQLDCQFRCNGNGLASGTTCYAYDFDTLSNLCYIFTTNSYNRNAVGGAPNVNHYVKATNCGGSGTCTHTFFEYTDRNGAGGVQQSGTVNTAEHCKATCIASSVTCYGYDFNTINSLCFLFQNSNYQLRTVEAKGINHYKRSCAGTTQCKFTKYGNTNGAGGLLQQNIGTQSDCQSRCNGNGIASGITCYAYDFDTLSNLCYIFTSNSYTRNPEGGAVNVNHYVKATNCGGSGTSDCKFTEYTNTNGAGGILQSNVKTQVDCQSRCNGNGITSGTTCYAYDFDTLSNLCYIFTSNSYRRNVIGGAPNVNHYVKATNCGSGASQCKFTRYLNTNGAGGRLQSSVGTQLNCQSRCNGDGLPSGTICYAYDYDILSNLCYIFTTNQYIRNPVGATINVNHYVKDANCGESAGLCTYVTKLNTNGLGGLLQSGVTDTSKCRDRCNGAGLASGVTCYGYDFNTQNKQCFIFINKNYQTSTEGGTVGVNHFVKTGSCLGKGTCTNNFFEYADSNGAGGILKTGVSTAVGCKDACIASTATCYGYDFNTLQRGCYLFVTANYQINNNGAPGVNHFKRTCTAASTCQYTKSENTNGPGGMYQNGVATQSACEDRCNGNGLQADATCYGYDFDGNSNLCYIFLKTYTTNPQGQSPGITHYRKQAGSGCLTVCVESYNATANKNAPGGADVGQQTVDECKALCENRTNCFGFDSANGRCWVHELKDYTLNAGVANGVTNYRRLFNCVGGTTVSGSCIDTYTAQIDVNVVGASRLQGTYTTTSCIQQCTASNTRCYGADYDNNARACYLFYTNIASATPQSSPGTTHYVRTTYTCSTGGCTSSFVNKASTNGIGGTRASVNGATPCERACLESPVTCYGYDVRGTAQAGECYLFFTKGYAVNEGTAFGITNFRRTCLAGQVAGESLAGDSSAIGPLRPVYRES